MKVDLHIHTTYSDGLLTPEQVVKKAIDRNLQAIAITDHDTVDGILPAIIEARKYEGFEVIPGIELSTYYDGQEVHILGYYIDYKDLNLKKELLDLQQNRQQRLEKIIYKLNNIGVLINIKDVQEKARGSSVGRPHVALALIEKGYVTSIKEAFDKYLSKGRPAYVPRKKLTPSDAIKLIKNSDGIPVLAHPGLLENDSIIHELIESGIMGIEVIHKDHTQIHTDCYTKLALENNLLLTGGSDSHGEEPLLLGTLNVPIEYVTKLKDKAKVKM
ncbi:PHP domain-containing protein [Tepidanaerobacter sp. GT38]|uniref:PHP domain-containing protein n=1 Tax=Tepidanaerobacter sp. GT38 TaxID=2722793 RepID=UPI001F020E77|nr:PHP domain-containing protein [Tepidanaerobacter sp. GT38]MCG1011792.1 PHP domain-containing protein [Tepidanaerobacter sp. GT38]